MSYSNKYLGTLAKHSLDGAHAIANSTFTAVEQAAALNLQTARSTLEHGLSRVRALSEAKEPQEVWALGGAVSQPGIEQAIAWSRGLYDIVSRTQHEIGQRGEALIGEFTRSLSDFLDDFAKNAPTGSQHGIAAVKSALSPTRSTLDNISNTSRKVAELADANVAAAGAAIKSASSKQSSHAASKAA